MNRLGYVYVIGVTSGKAVKIGWTTDLYKRIRVNQVGSYEKLSYLAVMRGSQKAEARIHRRLSRHRIRGEWFLPHQDVLDLIKSPSFSKEKPPGEHPVYLAILSMSLPWKGLAADLLNVMRGIIPDEGCPRDGRALSCCVRGMAPALKQEGVLVSNLDKGGQRGFVLTRAEGSC